LKDSRDQLTTVQGEKEALEGRVAKLTPKEGTRRRGRRRQSEVERLNGEKVSLGEDLAKAQVTIEELKKRLQGGRNRPAASDNAVAVASLTAGDKGRSSRPTTNSSSRSSNSRTTLWRRCSAPSVRTPPQLEMNVRRAAVRVPQANS
jgi:hypothetical protein